MDIFEMMNDTTNDLYDLDNEFRTRATEICRSLSKIHDEINDLIDDYCEVRDERPELEELSADYAKMIYDFEDIVDQIEMTKLNN